METFGLAAYLALAGVAIAQSLLLALQTWEHRRYVRSCMRGLERHEATGHVAVFAPCKGVDEGLEDNLRALLSQDYHDYEVTFIVESADDPACEAIRRVIAEHPLSAARLLCAGRATTCGQKVHNLRAATAVLSPQVEYLAFVDSDARPRPEWLRMLTARLCGHGTAAVTGYRWFVPSRASVPNFLLYSMNCGVMSLLGRRSYYLVWGGSWGIRREVFESINLREAWKNTLSDDLVASRELRRAAVAVRFEPACVVASPLDSSAGQMFTFIRRQYYVGRFYVPGWWAPAVFAATLTNLTWAANLVVLSWGLAHGTPLAWVAGGVCAALYFLLVFRGLVRQDLIGTYFPNRQEELRKAARFDVWAGPVVGLVHWLGMLGSFLGRGICWRGIWYRVLPGGRIHTVRRDEEPILSYHLDKDGSQPDGPPPGQVPYRKAG